MSFANVAKQSESKHETIKRRAVGHRPEVHKLLQRELLNRIPWKGGRYDARRNHIGVPLATLSRTERLTVRMLLSRGPLHRTRITSTPLYP